jgi:hypothetical protein
MVKSAVVAAGSGPVADGLISSITQPGGNLDSRRLGEMKDAYTVVHGAGQRSLSGWMQVKVSQSDKRGLGIWKVSTNLATRGDCG